MTVDALLAQLEGVRAHGTERWQARCPSHEDRSPSLSLRLAEDGRILAHCFAGCSVHEVCGALGIRVAELFADAPRQSSRQKRTKLGTKPWRYDWRRTAFAFQFYADGQWLRAQSVLEAANGLKTAEWSDEDFDTAIQAVAWAYKDLDRADALEDMAFEIRQKGLSRERHGNHTRSGKARRPDSWAIGSH